MVARRTEDRAWIVAERLILSGCISQIAATSDGIGAR